MTSEPIPIITKPYYEFGLALRMWGVQETLIGNKLMHAGLDYDLAKIVLDDLPADLPEEVELDQAPAIKKAVELKGSGMANDAAALALATDDLPPALAKAILEELDLLDDKGTGVTDCQTKSRAMFVGLAWMIGGLIITGITYSNAKTSGGTYFVCYGAVIYGAMKFLQGLIGK